MKIILLGLGVLFNLTAFASADVMCVRYCQQRTFSGRCLQYGADYCDVGPGVACIPRCVQRTFQGRCSNYGGDFCGIYPACQPHCTQPSHTGHCMTYGQDACFEFAGG